jgi:hypothetical protein
VGRNLEPGQTVLEQHRRDQDLALTMVSSQRRKVCLHQSHRRRPCHQNHGDEHRTRSHHGDHVHAGCSLDVTHIDLLCSATPGPAVDSVRTMSVVFRDRNDPSPVTHLVLNHPLRHNAPTTAASPPRRSPWLESMADTQTSMSCFLQVALR